MADYQRPNPLLDFVCAGMSFQPVDKLQPGKYPFLENIRVTNQGKLESRGGTQPFITTPLDQLNVHSIRRLNDPAPGAARSVARIIGAGTKLYTDASAVAIDTGYSGNPLSLVPWRPDQSVEGFMYVGDSAKMSKVRADATLKPWGIPQPVSPPTTMFQPATASQPGRQYNAITGPGPFTVAGTASSSAAVYQVPVRTVAQCALYPLSSAGMYSLAINTTVPALPTYKAPDMVGIFPGVQFVTQQGGSQVAQVFVEQVFFGLADSTIGTILYDNNIAGTGACTIVPVACPNQQAGNSASFANPDLSVRTNGIGPGSWILLNGTEYCLVQAVINGPDGSACIRVNTVNHHAAAETIVFIPTVIVTSQLVNLVTLFLGGGFSVFVLDEAIAVTAGTGFSNFTFTSPYPNVGQFGYGYKQHDYVSLSMYVDVPANLAAITLAIDVDVNGNNDYLHNAYYTVLEANELIDPANQGSGQWVQFSVRLSDFLRIGSDDSASFQTLYGIQLRVDCVGTVNIAYTSNPVMFGGGAADVGTAVNDYYYRYRWRNLDGAYSNWSPATRDGLHLVRNVGIISVPSGSGYDKADIARFGGALTSWNIIGTVDLSTLPAAWTLVDNNADEAIAALPQAQLDDFQPFPDIDVPHSGTCTVFGNKVFGVTGNLGSVPTPWAPGSEILINGVFYHLYGPSAIFVGAPPHVVLEIVENAGNQPTPVPFLLAGPTLMAQPLPAVWGPDDQGTIFAGGSNYQPGVVFFTNPNSPDNASDKNQVEVGSPTDPVIGGTLNAGRAIVCTSTKWWAMYPAVNGPSRYGPPVELQVGKPLWCRTAICSDGQLIFFVSDDGVYLTVGAAAQSITDEDLRDIFPHDGKAGRAVPRFGVTVYPPDLTQVNFLRLSICDRLVFFNFKDTNANLATLVYDLRLNGWVSYDVYNFSPTLFYEEEGSAVHNVLIGSNDGTIKQFFGNADMNQAGTVPVNIPGQVNPPCFNAGDFRADKKWGDLVLDYDATGAATGIVLTPEYNNYATAAASSTLTGVGRTLSLPVDLAQTLARNLAPQLKWAEQVAVILYGWQPSYIVEPEDITTRITEWDNAGVDGAKFVQGCILVADTNNVAKSINVQGDAGVIEATLNATHNGQTEIAYSFATPFITHLLRLASTDLNPWRFYGVRWVYEPVPELANNWITQGTDHDLQAFMHVKEAQIAHISTADLTFQIQWDTNTITLTIPNSGGAYKKTYLILPFNKGKIYTYSLTSAAGFRLFKRDCEVKVKQWGSTGPYLPMNPFGDYHRADGARI